MGKCFIASLLPRQSPRLKRPPVIVIDFSSVKFRREFLNDRRLKESREHC